jgi:AcrR family transcriptional regulator
MEKTCKRDEIIQAALEIIAEHGFHGAPMSMIAEKASVGAGTIYRYFESKDALIAVLYEELADKLVSALRQNYSEADTLKERFLHLSRTILKYFVDHPVDCRFLEQYFNSPYGVSLRREKMKSKTGEQDVFKKFFEQGIEQKVLKDLPLFIHFGMTIGPINFLARDHISGLIALDDAQIARVTEACWDAIKRSSEF